MAYEKTEDKKETIRIGLIQMSMSDDAEANTSIATPGILVNSTIV